MVGALSVLVRRKTNDWARRWKETLSPKQVSGCTTEPTNLLWRGQHGTLTHDLILITVKTQARVCFFMNKCFAWSAELCTRPPQRERLLTCKWSHHFRIFFWHLCSLGKAAQVCGAHPRAQITLPGPEASGGPPGLRQCPETERQPWWAAQARLTTGEWEHSLLTSKMTTSQARLEYL